MQVSSVVILSRYGLHFYITQPWQPTVARVTIGIQQPRQSEQIVSTYAGGKRLPGVDY